MTIVTGLISKIFGARIDTLLCTLLFRRYSYISTNGVGFRLNLYLQLSQGLMTVEQNLIFFDQRLQESDQIRPS